VLGFPNVPFVYFWALADFYRLTSADFKGNKDKTYLILWVSVCFGCLLAG